MGKCGSVEDGGDNVGSERGDAALSDIKIEVDSSSSASADEELAIFAETVKLTVLLLLRRLAHTLAHNAEHYTMVCAKMDRGLSPHYMDIVPMQSFRDCFRHCFTLPSKVDPEPVGIDANDPAYPQRKFEALLDAVESAPARRPGLTRKEHVTQLQTACRKTVDKLEAAKKELEADMPAEVQAHLTLFVHCFGNIFGTHTDLAVRPRAIYDNIDRVIAS